MGSKFNNFTINFETHEIAEAALKRAHEEIQKVKNSQNKTPRIEWFRERAPIPFHQRDSSGPGSGPRGASAVAGGPSSRGGYTSGGASDSEGGRGRGGFGGRGRGRGDRARGPRGGGRGGFPGRTDGPPDSKPTDSKPTEAKSPPPKESS